MTLTVGSLFSGIGGLDLGLERAGMTVKWQSEIDPYASRVLAKHWPTVPNLGDITRIDWSTVPRVDLVCGGYPCQPFSTAGRRGGDSDPRHLWPHMLDAVRHLRPRYVLAENVPGHLGLGFDRVLADLAASGFDAEWGCVSAASVGAPHLRNRLFVVAHTNAGRWDGWTWELGQGWRAQFADGGDDVADAAQLFGDGKTDHTGSGSESSGPVPQSGNSGGAARPVNGGWAVEPDVGRVAHGIPSRVDRLRCLGNAVVPQVAEYIGQQIMENANVRA